MKDQTGKSNRKMNQKTIRIQIGKKAKAPAALLASDFKKLGRDIVKAASDTMTQVQRIAMDSYHRIERTLK
jgi:hypothetical protein